MSTTATSKRSLKTVLDEANPNEIADAIRKLRLGTMLTPLKRVFTGLTAAAAFDLTAIDASGETTGVNNPNRLPALVVHALEGVTESSGTASKGTYVIGVHGVSTTVDPTNSTVAGVATLSDDGKTITFPEADVTGFTIIYLPRTVSAAEMAADFAPQT